VSTQLADLVDALRRWYIVEKNRLFVMVFLELPEGDGGTPEKQYLEMIERYSDGHGARLQAFGKVNTIHKAWRGPNDGRRKRVDHEKNFTHFSKTSFSIDQHSGSY
jgi:hypothetical protein